MFKKEKFPVSDFLSKNGFYIPSGIDITKKQMKHVAESINSIFK
jgi:dTDP-4-amino-4,6-dideoxygalactose transaminase